MTSPAFTADPAARPGVVFAAVYVPARCSTTHGAVVALAAQLGPTIPLVTRPSPSVSLMVTTYVKVRGAPGLDVPDQVNVLPFWVTPCGSGVSKVASSSTSDRSSDHVAGT